MRRDEQIVRADGPPRTLESGPETPVRSSDRLLEREDVQVSQETVEDRMALLGACAPLRPCRSSAAVTMLIPMLPGVRARMRSRMVGCRPRRKSMHVLVSSRKLTRNAGPPLQPWLTGPLQIGRCPEGVEEPPAPLAPQRLHDEPVVVLLDEDLISVDPEVPGESDRLAVPTPEHLRFGATHWGAYIRRVSTGNSGGSGVASGGCAAVRAPTAGQPPWRQETPSPSCRSARSSSSSST